MHDDIIRAAQAKKNKTVNKAQLAIINGAAMDDGGKAPKVKMKRLNVEIPEALHDKLRDDAYLRRTTLHDIVNKWANDHIEHMSK